MQVIECRKSRFNRTGCTRVHSQSLVDRIDEKIVALHYSSAKMEKPDKIIKGKTADAIYSKIIELGLVSREDHAAYLGGELAKAEIALRTGKEYIQDKAMFTK